MSDDDFNPYEWHVGDPADWGDSVGVPDIPYMGYLNNGDDEDDWHPHEPSQARDQILAKKASELEEKGIYGEALALINQALEINPNRSNNWNIKAIILDNWGKHEDALKYYDRSLAIRDSPVVRGNKAQCLYRISKINAFASKVTEKDLERINEALKILPDDDGRNEYIKIKGDILDALGRRVQAKKCYFLAAGMYDDIKKLERQENLIKSSNDFLINIAGRKFHEASRNLRCDEFVDLVKELQNIHDPNAIRVEFNGETVGYVGNSPQTVPEGIKSASDIQNTFTDKVKARILFWYLDYYLIAKLII